MLSNQYDISRQATTARDTPHFLHHMIHERNNKEFGNCVALDHRFPSLVLEYPTCCTFYYLFFFLLQNHLTGKSLYCV